MFVLPNSRPFSSADVQLPMSACHSQYSYAKQLELVTFTTKEPWGTFSGTSVSDGRLNATAGNLDADGVGVLVPVGVALLEGVPDCEGVCDAVCDGVPVSDGVCDGVTEGDAVSDAEGDGVLDHDGVSLLEGEGVLDHDGEGVSDFDGLGDSVTDADAVALTLGLCVMLALAVGVGVACPEVICTAAASNTVATAQCAAVRHMRDARAQTKCFWTQLPMKICKCEKIIEFASERM